MTPSQEAAANYFARGYRLVRLPLGSKKPDTKGWPDLEVRAEWLTWMFVDCNIGIILGAKSNHLVDIDLDCPEAITLADCHLPQTYAVFGRPSKPRSHRLYVSAGSVYEAFADPIGGQMLLEIRADGRTGGAHLSVLPPSVHPSGEPINWTDSDEPAVVGAAILAASARRLAVGCLIARHISPADACRPLADWPQMLAATDPSLGRVARKWLGICQPARPQRRPAVRRPQSRCPARRNSEQRSRLGRMESGRDGVLGSFARLGSGVCRV
jgi:Bifunctional DNA primase/polymerase, N-terminal